MKAKPDENSIGGGKVKSSRVLKLIIALVLVGTLVAVGACKAEPAPTETFDWTITTVTHMEEYANKIFVKWAERISERTGGNLDIKVRAVIELGYKGPEQLREVKAGAVEGSISPEGYVQGDEPAIGVTWLPFLTPDWESGRAGYEAIKPLIDEVLQEKWNCKLMWMHPFPEIAIHTTTKEIKTLDDFEGLKLRSPGGYWAQAIELAGGAAALIPQDDTYTALQRGTVDGALTSFQTFVNLSWYEACGVSNRIPFVATTGTLTYFNLDAWNSLPDNYQKIVLDECQKVEDELWARSKTVDADLHFPVLEARDHVLVTPEPKLVSEWAELCKPLWQQWAERGGDTTKAILEAYAKAVGASY